MRRPLADKRPIGPFLTSDEFQTMIQPAIGAETIIGDRAEIVVMVSAEPRGADLERAMDDVIVELIDMIEDIGGEVRTSGGYVSGRERHIEGTYHLGETRDIFDTYIDGFVVESRNSEAREISMSQLEDAVRMHIEPRIETEPKAVGVYKR